MSAPQKYLYDILQNDCRDSLGIKLTAGRSSVAFERFLTILVERNIGLLIDERSNSYVFLPYRMKKQDEVM